MSGGQWGYRSHEFEDLADREGTVVTGLRLLGAIEHELDWGVSADTCLACAERRVIAALMAYFDHDSEGALMAVKARDRAGLMCSRCLRAVPTWHRREGAKPTVAEAEQELAERAA